MIRLFDRLSSGGTWNLPSYGLPADSFGSVERTLLPSQIKACTVVALDNVAELYDRDYLPEKKQEEVEWSSIPDMDFFPKVVSPFPAAFYEFPLSRKHYHTVWNDTWRSPIQVGFAVVREEKHHKFLGFMREDNKIHVIAEGVWDTDEQGKLVGDLMILPAGLKEAPPNGWDGLHGLPGFCGYMKIMSVVGLGMSLLHCKNVSVSTEQPEPQLSRAFNRRNGKPLVEYKILKVHPVGKSSANGSWTETTEAITKRLHICRGHFKDYSKSGVFGKVKGIFWWEQHARGSVERGTLVKDYQVEVTR